MWQGLRALFGALDDAQFALGGRALQIVDWDRTHQFCGACGTATVARTSERSPRMPGLRSGRLSAAGAGGDGAGAAGTASCCWRARHGFRKGMYSALAGFVEPGETLEQCLEREVS